MVPDPNRGAVVRPNSAIAAEARINIAAVPARCAKQADSGIKAAKNSTPMICSTRKRGRANPSASCAPAQREDRHQIEDDERGGGHEHAQQHRGHVSRQQPQHGHPHPLSWFSMARRKAGVSVRRQAHVQTHEHQQALAMKGQAPSPAEQLPVIERDTSARKAPVEHRKPRGAPSCGNMP